MKKLLTIILALAMAASFAACSGGEKGKENTQTNNETSVSQHAEDTSKSDVPVVDMRGTNYADWEIFYECDEYSLRMAEGYQDIDDYNPEYPQAHYGYVLINKTDMPFYTEKRFYDDSQTEFATQPGDRDKVNDYQLLETVKQAGVYEVLVAPVDMDGNPLPQVKLIFGVPGEEDSNSAETNEIVFVDNDLVKVVYNGVKKPHRANLSVTNKTDALLKINRDTMDLPRAMTETYDEAYKENGDGTATIWVQITDMSDKEDIEKVGDKIIYGYMHYQYTVTFSLEDGHVINMEEMSDIY